MMSSDPVSASGNVRIVLSALIGVALAAVIASFIGRAPPPGPERATVLASPIPLPEFTLSDERQRPFTRSAFEDHWSLVFFGFTSCPDVCPLTLQQLALARRRMAEQLGDDDLPDIIFISVDPERDTADAIGAYASAFGDGVVAVNGTLPELNKLTGALGIYHARTATGGGEYTVEHSAAVIVINDRAEYHAVFSPPHDVDAIVRDMALIMAAR